MPYRSTCDRAFVVQQKQSEGIQKKLYHMNIRLPADYKEKVEGITEYYQSIISLGRLAKLML